LHVIGSGARSELVERLVADLPEQTRWTRALSTDEVVAALDASTLLVLPSRSEGLGRVIVEALCRGRPVLAAAVGGIRDIVRDGENGVLVPPGDTQALAEALVRLLSDRAEAERLASAARPSVEPWLATPEEYAQRVRALVDGTIKPSP
jgi:glycosyltransferase involved in cell wall biosynthesis